MLPCCLRQLRQNQNRYRYVTAQCLNLVSYSNPRLYRLNRDGTFLRGVDASHVYVRAWALGCFHSLIRQYPNLSEGADRVGGQLRGDKECPFSGVTKSGRVWRKVRGKQCSECGY